MRILIALFHGFILQQAWDEHLQVEPYVATIEEIFQALLGPASPPQVRNQGDANELARE